MLRCYVRPALRVAPFYRYYTNTPLCLEHKIYRSPRTSIQDELGKEETLYDFMMARMKAADSQKIASVQVETGELFTYPQLIAATHRVAQVLYHAANIRKGDVVSICLLNNVMYGPLTYGILELGGIASTVNAVAAPSTLAYHFKTNGCKVVLGMKFFQKALEQAVEICERETGEKISVLYPEDFMKLKDRLEIPSTYDAQRRSEDTIVIPFSSGTTGLPKGVQLTNKALIANTLQVADAFVLTKKDVSVTILPFFHIYGFTCCLNSILSAGATQVVMTKYNVDEYVNAIEKYKATVNLVAPPIIVSLVKNAEQFKNRDLSSLRHVISGAATLGGVMEKQFNKIFPQCCIGQGYGMTEMSPVTTAVPMQNPGEELPSGTVGTLVADTEMRLVKVDDSQQSGEDKSAGIDCEEGEEGEIWFRGPQMMKGYLKDEDTEKTMHDGWYRTGDIGAIDKETGFLIITDRLKELIKYKGFQVSPASMESSVLEHPWVQDCLVVGVPDPRDVSFENPRALVVLKPNLSESDVARAADEICHFIMSHNPPHKRLHGGVRIVDEIPRNAAGKPMRRHARQEETALIKKQHALQNGP